MTFTIRAGHCHAASLANIIPTVTKTVTVPPEQFGSRNFRCKKMMNSSDGYLCRMLSSTKWLWPERSSRSVTQLSALTKHTNSANCKDEEPFWIKFPPGFTMKLKSRLSLLRLLDDITSFVNIYMQHDKQQTAEGWWRVGGVLVDAGCWFEFHLSDSCLTSNWIWFESGLRSIFSV